MADIFKQLAKVRTAARREIGRLQQQRDQLDSQIAELQQLLGSGSEGSNGVGRTVGRKAKPAATSKKRGRKGKRIRRSPEQLQAIAAKVAGFIKSKGSEGASGKEIRKQFADEKLPAVLPPFLEQFGGVKVRQTGERASSRYSLK